MTGFGSAVVAEAETAAEAVEPLNQTTPRLLPVELLLQKAQTNHPAESSPQTNSLPREAAEVEVDRIVLRT